MVCRRSEVTGEVRFSTCCYCSRCCLTFCLILYMFLVRRSCIFLTSAARNVFFGRAASFLSSLNQDRTRTEPAEPEGQTLFTFSPFRLKIQQEALLSS